MAISPGRAPARRAISGPLTPVTGGLSRSLVDTPLRRSGHATGPDGTASQADSAGSIPVTRFTVKMQVKGLACERNVGLPNCRKLSRVCVTPPQIASSAVPADSADMP